MAGFLQGSDAVVTTDGISGLQSKVMTGLVKPPARAVGLGSGGNNSPQSRQRCLIAFVFPRIGGGSRAGWAAAARGCHVLEFSSFMAEPRLCWPQRLQEMSEPALRAPKDSVIAGSATRCR